MADIIQSWKFLMALWKEFEITSTASGKFKPSPSQSISGVAIATEPRRFFLHKRKIYSEINLNISKLSKVFFKHPETRKVRIWPSASWNVWQRWVHFYANKLLNFNVILLRFGIIWYEVVLWSIMDYLLNLLTCYFFMLFFTQMVNWFEIYECWFF